MNRSEIEQYKRFAALSFADKVRWLEEAHCLAIKFRAKKYKEKPSNKDFNSSSNKDKKTF